ncbi:MAG TPA: DNA primase [Actinomycetota bacterium]|nr:DNA primase [Actinomycetota bacterium]
MAGRIRDDDLAAVRERTDIAKLVSQYLTLRKSGHDSMVGLCPFHTEKTPSFSISPSKGVYYCFGCGAGGDAVRFLQQVENLTFVEAVERLAKEAGITLRYEGDSAEARRASSRRQSLHRANERAAELYHRTLLEGREGADARVYLESRGIDPETAKAFSVGYAPGYPDFLLRRLSTEFSTEVLLEAGLATRDVEGGVRDRFRGRITFPVHDLGGKNVGFGARILPNDPRAGEQAKYLNTAETPIYRKNELLYNLNRARGAITKNAEAYVVEGYTDVIGLTQAGIASAVATCGTALGEEHFRLLSRFAQRLVLSFDSDEAGARAAERAYAFHERYPVRPVVLILPEGQDPADFVRAHGADAVGELAAGAKPLVEYMIRRTVGRRDLSNVEGQSAAVAAALPIVQGLSDQVRREEYAHLLAELVGVSDNAVLAALDRNLAGRPSEVVKAVKRGSVHEKVEREMLKLLARDETMFKAFGSRLSEEHFRSADHRHLYAALRKGKGDVARIVAEAHERVAGQVSALALEPLDGDATEEYAEGVWARLEEFLLKRRSQELRDRLQKLNPIADTEYDGLFQQLISLDGELRRLRDRGEGVAPATP